ncbi:ThiF family adenylyltransferase [Nannocystis sp. RBIL2]|uniref:HesA/MoeB/ThiF family protein n=1 Tax=Nannocystis sp. RBIL2 TaxID=2996788 RepID=UPI002271027D|nr:ThiF family adenylyltransferase [Nannocystis sp. RBIL2]MCY1071196.1 ThiF family adenylyltransferase [Nannocystis sp. RBIL2]
MLPCDIGAPTLEGALSIDGETCWVRLTLPPGYPALPPELREIDGERGNIVPFGGRDNRFPDGTICLFPHGNDPQAWSPERLAVEALERFTSLVRRDRARGEGRTLHRIGRERLIIQATAAAILRVPRGYGTLHARRPDSGRGDFFVDWAECETLPLRPHPELSPGWRAALRHEDSIFWLRVPMDGAEWATILAGSAALDEFLGGRIPPALHDRLRNASLAVLVREESEALDAVLVHRPRAAIGTILVCQVLVSSPEALRHARADAIIPQRDALARVRIVMIGLGSLGGAIALALARTGVRRFTLIDPDVLTPENLSRHTGTVADLGKAKVELVADAIRAIDPDAEVQTIRKFLTCDLPWLGAHAELETLLESDEPALLVTTCAADAVELQVNALALRTRTPALYAAVLGAADHGRIFRVLPGESACYECIRAAQSASPALHPRFELPEDPQRVPYLHPELPGLGIDVAQIALLTAKFALQTLGTVWDLGLGLTKQSGDHLLWTNRGGWVFDHPQQLRIERIPRDPNCPACGDAAQAETITPADAEALAALKLELTKTGEEMRTPGAE